MIHEKEIMEKIIQRAFSGEGAHVEAKNIFDGLDWKVAGVEPDGSPHSVFQILRHLIYWQDWAMRWLDGKKPRVPKHAAGSWPGSVAPKNKKEWDQSVKRFLGGIDGISRRYGEADPFAKHGKTTRLEMLHILASHNSYHLGQVVTLRIMQEAWPPPSGSLTW